MRGVLPTVAALALALAGCSATTTEEGSEIAADPTSHTSGPLTPSSASAAPKSAAGALDPTPVHMPGEPALVVPITIPTAPPTATPTVKTSPRPYVGTPVPPPTKHPKLGGEPTNVSPSGPLAPHPPNPWST